MITIMGITSNRPSYKQSFVSSQMEAKQMKQALLPVHYFMPIFIENEVSVPFKHQAIRLYIVLKSG